MTKILIIHGAYGNPEENWFPWLKGELEELRHQVFIPRFPTPENQTLENWLKVFEEYSPDEDTVVVGHSLGVPFLLTVLEKQKVKAAFFVAGFCNLLGKEQFDQINKTFVEKKFDWEKIKTNCKKFYLYHSDNDPYVNLEKSEELGKRLGVVAKVIEKAGHFSTETANYKEFSGLLEDIKEEA